MALEDLADVPRGPRLAPCSTRATRNQTAKLVAAMADLDGHLVTCARRARDTPVIYGPDEEFPIGGSKVVRSSDDDDVDDRRRRDHAARGAGGRRRARRRGHRARG